MINLICGIGGIVDLVHPKQGISDIETAGFDSMLLDFNQVYVKDKDGENMVVDRLQEKIKLYTETVKAECITIAKAPCAKERFDYNQDGETIKQAISESLKIAMHHGCSKFIVPLLNANDNSKKVMDENKELLLSLLEICSKSDITVLPENQCRYYNGHYIRGAGSDADELLRLILEVGEIADKRYGRRKQPYIGVCVNVGNCNLCGQNVNEFCHILAPYIQAVIVSDGDGNKHHSLLPFTAANQKSSQTDWLGVIRGLRNVCANIQNDLDMILDMEDTAYAFSPLLRPELMRFAKTTMDYLKWQIEMESMLGKYRKRVLFGAGNMCRNYMKNYGEKYPPLYTCDNNQNLWGTTFEGMVIEPPDKLRELPKDVAIFICNIYYREIEAQIRRMGIKNPIEFFNDEYLPSFHFDRIDVRDREKRSTE